MAARGTEERPLATPELAAVEVRGMTREAFLARATLAAAAAYGAGAVAPFVQEALAQSERRIAVGDISILNFTLTMELVEQSLYAEGATTGAIGGRVGGLTGDLARDEDDHVARLRAAITKLGGRPVAEPDISFGPALASQGRFLAVAQSIEETVVAAVNGSIPNVASKAVIEQLGALGQVDARHAALIALARDDNPAPKAFEDTLTIPQARERLAPFVPEFGG